LPVFAIFFVFLHNAKQKAELLDHFKPVCSAYFMLVKFLRLEILENYYIKALVIRALFIVCATHSPGKKRRLEQLFHKSYSKGILYFLVVKGDKVGATKEIKHKIFQKSVKDTSSAWVPHIVIGEDTSYRAW
jgi:hypothetical protein